MTIKKIVRDGVSDQVYSQLKENVAQGVWQPGEKIPSENQLVSLFGVSRASIRMAIQKMITLGLLESKVGDGTYVRPPDPGAYVERTCGSRPQTEGPDRDYGVQKGIGDRSLEARRGKGH